MGQRTPHSHVFPIAIIASSILCFLAFPVNAQVTLYDNLDDVRSSGNYEDWQPASGRDGRFAQQFFLGAHTNIDQVTVSLLRPRPAVTGSLRFELWRDNGSGQPVPVDDPTGKIADLGKVVDVTQIPAGTFGEFTFDNLILGLEPNQPYWIVTDYEAVQGIGGDYKNIGLAVVFGGDPMYPDPPGYDSTAGTFGAAHIHGYRNQNPYWNDMNNVFGLEHFYQAMKVEAMEVAKPPTVALYDTLDTERDPVTEVFRWRGWPEASSEWLTQPFMTGSQDNVASVTVDLHSNGSPTGSFDLDVWDDDGTGRPGHRVGRLGSIDFASLNDDEWQFRTVDEHVSGLQPDSRYHLVLNFDEAGINTADFVAVPATQSADGTNGADRAKVRLGNNWVDFFDNNYRFIQMTIEASVASPHGDLNNNGTLDAIDIDILSSAVRQSLTDSQYDINVDGTVDSTDRDHWVRDSAFANTYFGDSNLDGEFNSSDLTLVFSGGEYEDNITLNSSWAEGDWNGDGDFDSSDLVAAFSDGGYEQGPKAAIQAVPELSSVSMLLLSFPFAIGLLRRTRNRGN